VCDSCFNIGCNRADFLKAEAFMAGKGARLPPKANDAENREVLFGDFKKLDGGDKSSTEATKSSTEATMASMAEAKQRLHERGEKLEQLSDKSAKLADASKEFANIAKQLRQQNQQQSWWS
jgi:phage I-like protein